MPYAGLIERVGHLHGREHISRYPLVIERCLIGQHIRLIFGIEKDEPEMCSQAIPIFRSRRFDASLPAP
jgi:hypothetical protein